MAKKMKGLKLQRYIVNYIDEHGTDDVEDISLELEFECGLSRPAADGLAEALCWDNSSRLAEFRKAVNEANERERIAEGPWQNHPATDRQKIYLVSLGVDFDSKTLTKGRASDLIDAAKNGHLGSVNGFYRDGSN